MRKELPGVTPAVCVLVFAALFSLIWIWNQDNSIDDSTKRPSSTDEPAVHDTAQIVSQAKVAPATAAVVADLPQDVTTDDSYMDTDIRDDDPIEPVEYGELFSYQEDDSETIEPSNSDFADFGNPISLNMDALNEIEVGDTMSLPLGDYGDLRATMVEQRDNGTTRIKFLIEGQPEMFRASITVGDRVTYGRVITPEGGYEMELVDGKGWIVDTRDMDKRIPENGVDFVIPGDTDGNELGAMGETQ